MRLILNLTAGLWKESSWFCFVTSQSFLKSSVKWRPGMWLYLSCSDSMHLCLNAPWKCVLLNSFMHKDANVTRTLYIKSHCCPNVFFSPKPLIWNPQWAEWWQNGLEDNFFGAAWSGSWEVLHREVRETSQITVSYDHWQGDPESSKTFDYFFLHIQPVCCKTYYIICPNL